MALSRKDKEEIAAMFEAFSERLTTGRKVKTAEEQALEVIAKALAPTVTGPRFVPLEEQVFGEVVESIIVPSKRKKRMSQFNRAVKQGMQIVKSSTSYGRKGVINNPKKAFTAVTKAVSKVNKALKAGKKKPKSGNAAIKKVFTAAAKILERQQARGKRDRWRIGFRRKKAAKKKKDYRDYDPQG